MRRPKSVRCGSPCSSSSTLAGLTSRWTIPWLVGVVQRLGQRTHDSCRLTKVETLCADVVGEHVARDVSGGEVVASPFEALGVVNGNDVGMVETGRRLALGQKPFDQGRVAQDAWTRHLEGDRCAATVDRRRETPRRSAVPPGASRSRTGPGVRGPLPDRLLVPTTSRVPCGAPVSGEGRGAPRSAPWTSCWDAGSGLRRPRSRPGRQTESGRRDSGTTGWPPLSLSDCSRRALLSCQMPRFSVAGSVSDQSSSTRLSLTLPGVHLTQEKYRNVGAVQSTRNRSGSTEGHPVAAVGRGVRRLLALLASVPQPKSLAKPPPGPTAAEKFRP